jgi:membrane fusion protein, heavy metal efflux system
MNSRILLPNSLFYKRFVIGFLSLFVVILAFWLVLLYAKAKPINKGAPLLHQGGRLIVPEQSSLRQYLVIEQVPEQLVISPFTLPAIVEANPATLIKILTPFVGRITSLNKSVGDAVKAGEVLFIIDSADQAQAMTDVEKAQSALNFAQENLQRQQKLSVSNIAARHDLQQARNDYNQAVSELNRANARVQALQLESPDQKTKYRLVARSPITGQVIELNAGVGSVWNDTTAAIMTVADLSRVYISASAQEKDLKNIYAGQDVSVVMDAYPQPLRSKVQYVNAVLNPDTRTVSVRILINNNLSQLKPNMFAKATFFGQPHKGVVLPLSAVIQRGFYSVAFVEVAPWQFEPRQLELGSQLDDKVEVLSGLKANERVVVKGGIILND